MRRIHSDKRLQTIVTAIALNLVVMGSSARCLEAPAEAPAAKVEMKGGLRRMVQTLASHDLAVDQEWTFHAIAAATSRHG